MPVRERKPVPASIDSTSDGCRQILLGVQRDHLIEPDRVVGPRLRVVQRGAGEPHVGADVRVGLGAVRMVQPAQEAELLAERGERLGRFAEDEFAVALGRREPAPLVDAVLRLRQRHAVGGVERTEAAGDLLGHFRAHGVEDRQGQRDAAQTLEEGTAVDAEGCAHGWSGGLISEGDHSTPVRFRKDSVVYFSRNIGTVDDKPDHVLHAVAVRPSISLRPVSGSSSSLYVRLRPVA